MYILLLTAGICVVTLSKPLVSKPDIAGSIPARTAQILPISTHVLDTAVKTDLGRSNTLQQSQLLKNHTNREYRNNLGVAQGRKC